MTSSQHVLYTLGDTHATMASTMGRQAVRRSQSTKAGLSSDGRLQPACLKPEWLVTVGQHTTVNTFPGLVHTARHTMGVGFTRSRLPNRKEGADHGELHDWGEVVTR